VVTRAVCVVLLLGPEHRVGSDLRYFAASFRALGQLGVARTLVEYPVPAFGVLVGPWACLRALGLERDYGSAVVLLALITDAAFLWLLARCGRPGAVIGPWVWVLAVPLLGATTLARFDLLPGVLVGAAVLLAARHPRTAGLFLALGTGVKLWPVLVVPGLLAAVRRRGATLLVMTVSGGALVAVSLAVAGGPRLVSPLTYQSQRGLQIESVAATPAMLARVVRPHRWLVSFSTHHAYEVRGPGTTWLTDASTVATGAFALLLVVTWVVAFRRRETLGAEAFVWLTLAAVTGFVATGKVFSPQYLLWVMPAAAAGLVVAGSRRLVQWVVAALVVCGLTQLVFPLAYGGLLQVGRGSAVAVGLLTLRNVLVTLLAVVAWWETGRVLFSRRGRARTAPRPGRPRGATTAR
jgi:hypothetical protein